MNVRQGCTRKYSRQLTELPPQQQLEAGVGRLGGVARGLRLLRRTPWPHCPSDSCSRARKAALTDGWSISDDAYEPTPLVLDRFA